MQHVRTFVFSLLFSRIVLLAFLPIQFEMQAEMHMQQYETK